MTVGIGLMGVVKHIARLRSWNESRRTAAFAVAYLVAWIFDLLVPLFSATLLALIVYPPSRDFMFPPAPLALVSTKTGGVQKPKAGVLGSTDSATGAPENYKCVSCFCNMPDLDMNICTNVYDVVGARRSKQKLATSSTASLPWQSPVRVASIPRTMQRLTLKVTYPVPPFRIPPQSRSAREMLGQALGAHNLTRSTTRRKCPWKRRCGTRCGLSCMVSLMFQTLGWLTQSKFQSID